MSHPATAGIDDLRNRFGFQLGSSIRTRWPARPVLVGRWGWSDPGSDAVVTGGSYYNAGEQLGDLVLAAEQPFGQGRVFVLGDTSPLQNDMLANAYPFVGRLLGTWPIGRRVRRRSGGSCWPWRRWWRWLALLAGRPAAWQVDADADGDGRVAGVLHGGGLLVGPRVARRPLARVRQLQQRRLYRRLAPGSLQQRFAVNRGEPRHRRSAADVDAAGILAAVGARPDAGAAGAVRAVDLDRAGPRVLARRSATPSSNSSAAGGTFICMVGAEESRPSAPLLADFDFKVPPSPVPPGEDAREPEPLGGRAYVRTAKAIGNVQFYAGWPVECDRRRAPEDGSFGRDGKNERPIVVSRSERGGIVRRDRRHALRQQRELRNRRTHDARRIRFWRWLLSRVVPGQKAWNPPPAGQTADPATGNPAKKDAEEDDCGNDND